MKNKLQKTVAIMLASIFCLLAGVAPVRAYEIGEYVRLENYGAQQCMSKNGIYLEISQLMHYNGTKSFPAYFYTYHGGYNYHGRKTIRQGEVDDDNLRKIILAGYPYHSYRDLGCTSEYAAYLATQLCILEYTQGEDLSSYTGCNSTGYQVENAIQKIKQNLASQYSIGETPIFSIMADTEWQDYPYDPNYIFKEMHIQCDTPSYPRAFTIQTAEDSQIEILDENNYPQTVFYAKEKWKMRVPKSVEETGMEIIIEAQTTNEMDNMWIVSSTENGELFILTQEREETRAETYTETIKKPEENPIPQQPNEEENGEKEGEENETGTNPEPTENQKPEETETQKPIEQTTNNNTNESKNENSNQNENGNHNSNVSTQTSENANQNHNNNQSENQNQKEQKINLVFQPNLPITNEIKQENQTNVTVQLQVKPEIFWSFLQQEDKENSFLINKEQKEKQDEEKSEKKEVAETTIEPKMETVQPTAIVQPKIKQATSMSQTKFAQKKVMTASPIQTKKLPRTGY